MNLTAHKFSKVKCFVSVNKNMHFKYKLCINTTTNQETLVMIEILLSQMESFINFKVKILNNVLRRKANFIGHIVKKKVFFTILLKNR